MENFLPSTAVEAESKQAPTAFAPGVLVARLSGAIGLDKPVNVDALRRQLFGIDFRHLHLEISSNGGDSAVAFDLCQLLRSLPVPVSARASHECMSGGLIVLMGADLRIAAPDTHLLIHPTGYGRESLPERVTAASLSEAAEHLRRSDRKVAQLFADRTGHCMDWFLKEKETEDLLSEADAIETGVIHVFEGINGPARPGWPAAVRAAMAATDIYFPEWMRSENYLSACRCAGSLFGENAP